VHLAQRSPVIRLVMKFIMSMESTVNKLIEIDAAGQIRVAD
jgi:hypothetical protein